MKIRKKFIAGIFALCVFAYAAQADDTAKTDIFGGTSSGDAAEIAAEGANTDVVLNPNKSDQSADAYFTGSGNTVSSISTSGSPANWILESGTTTIDIACADAVSRTALSNNGTMKLLGGSLIVENSKGSSATAVLDLGEFQMGDKFVQDSSTLEIRTNAKLTGSGFSANTSKTNPPEGVKQTLRITNNANVEASFGSDATFYRGSALVVDSGASFASVKNITINQGAELSVAGSLSANKDIFVYGTASITGAIKTLGYTASGVTTISGNGKIEAGSVEFNGNLTISDNALVVVSGSNPAITVNNANLTLDKRNAFLKADGKSGVNLSITEYGMRTNSLVVNADNEFGLLSIKNGKSFLTIKVSDGAHLVFDDIYAPNGVELYLEDFENGRVFLKKREGWDRYIMGLDGSIVRFNDVYDKTQLTLIDGQFNGESGYWLCNGSQIPEPATCALLFGAVAMSFAVLRRKK